MAYTKQTWNNGDIITADKLNHIEDGIAEGGSGGGGVFVVHRTNNNILDKTWQEIDTAIRNLQLVFLFDSGEGFAGMAPVSYAGEQEGHYLVDFNNGSGSFLEYITQSPDGYPQGLT